MRGRIIRAAFTWIAWCILWPALAFADHAFPQSFWDAFWPTVHGISLWAAFIGIQAMYMVADRDREEKMKNG